VLRAEATDSMIDSTLDEHANHYTTDAACVVNLSMCER